MKVDKTRPVRRWPLAQVSVDEKWQLSTAFAYTALKTLTSMRLGSTRASGVPLLGPTVRLGSEGNETYLHYTWHTKPTQPENEKN